MTVTFSTSIWAQERNIMTVGGFNSSTAYVQVICNTAPLSGLTAKYTRPATGSLQIDMSDLVRIINSGSVTVSERTSSGALIGSAVTKSWERAGLIQPENVIIPDNWEYAKIVPPDNMIEGFENQDIVAEFYNFNDRTYSVSGATWENQHRNLIIDGDFILYCQVSSQYVGKNYVLQQRDPCKKYATVEWVSFSGATRRHTFEVINCTTETIDAVSLQNLQNFYDERKGRRDGFVLRLEDLDRYDFWYYSDLITSSYVRVTLDGSNWRQVQVVTKAAKIPDNDEGKLNTLEIEVNYAKYDTL